MHYIEYQNISAILRSDYIKNTQVQNILLRFFSLQQQRLFK